MAREETRKPLLKMVHRSSDGKSTWDALYTKEQAEIVRHFHRSLPVYKPTPLVKLDHLAEKLGVAEICIKDESKRFGLNAFKGLGGSYCIARYVADLLGKDMKDLVYTDLQTPEVKEKLKDTVFVTATDGNHGRGIAWTASLLGVRAIVFMPKGSSEERLNNIRALGAEAEITSVNYDDTVRLAGETAEKLGGVLVQDTAWSGYETVPSWIMQGYMTMALEASEQMSQAPTHIFLQAGVGAMSGALSGFFSDCWKRNKPVITIVEPENADCIFRTAEADDDQLHNVTGDLKTIMAGLACGEPCTIGWDLIKAHADYFISAQDCCAADGMRILAAPLPGDESVVSGESGAATFGAVTEILRREELADIRRELGLNEKSRILCISTEGDTDQENYRRIVWDGAYSSL